MALSQRTVTKKSVLSVDFKLHYYTSVNYIIIVATHFGFTVVFSDYEHQVVCRVLSTLLVTLSINKWCDERQPVKSIWWKVHQQYCSYMQNHLAVCFPLHCGFAVFFTNRVVQCLFSKSEERTVLQFRPEKHMCLGQRSEKSQVGSRSSFIFTFFLDTKIVQKTFLPRSIQKYISPSILKSFVLKKLKKENDRIIVFLLEGGEGGDELPVTQNFELNLKPYSNVILTITIVFIYYQLFTKLDYIRI